MESQAKLSLVQPIVATGTSGGGYNDSPVAQEAERVARYRLVIEEGPKSGVFVYKLLDRVTGEIVKQIPREEIVRMMGEGRYRAGSVINTTV